MRFWHDLWLECPLRILYPRSFRVNRQSEVDMKKQEWNLEYRRNLQVEYLEEWEKLMVSLENVEWLVRRSIGLYGSLEPLANSP